MNHDENNKLDYLPDLIFIPGLIAFDNQIKTIDKVLYGVIYWLKYIKQDMSLANSSFLAQVFEKDEQIIKDALIRLAQSGYIQIAFDKQTNQVIVKQALVTMNIFS